jgi:hypothetical protein
MTKSLWLKAVRGVTAISLCASLGACVTARPTTPADVELLASALTTPVDVLRSQADAGQAQAQYAMAVLYAYGARGVVGDANQAAQLRGKALAARGYTPITTYIAGLRGKPGRVAIINTPRYALTPAQAWRGDQCAAALARGEESPIAVEACAGPDAFSRLKVLWAEAKSAS